VSVVGLKKDRKEKSNFRAAKKGGKKGNPIKSNFAQLTKKIDRNCDVLPLSLEVLLNYTTLMLKFCTNKPIWALLLRQVFFWGGERGRFAPKKGVTLILCKLNMYCKLL
jgi:hypothetical protein